ncbi:NACHT, LRR and PYD domains-containing protein 12-like isoform X2 [Pristis pectinata]|uniref:NACHT, LRR and PYD domains-containing protein 12-like isoform X2 n=1 Tax=Pristis pectinata TaxID=685728 RepID=UPI00223DBBAC|nr:NACHT, LRR and PYD domains-containing protein 12-like isoform X2 [Pristis pectinata]
MCSQKENGLINTKLNAETGSSIISPIIVNSNVNSMPIIIDMKSSCKSDQKEEQYEELKIHHKDFLKKKLECITDYTSIAGERVYLLQRFTELWITDCEYNKLYKEHEVTEIESPSSTYNKTNFNSIKCKDIFRPIGGQRQPRVVITKGIAGIGKTIYVKKFLLDWAMTKAHQEYDFVFSFQFCELNLISEERLSLLQLVQQHYPYMKDLSETYLEVSARSLFIFDGLDESNFPLEFEKTPVCSDIVKLLPLQSLLTNLIKGNLLPSASIWITTRPSTMNQIPSSYIDRVTEIQGFQDEEKKKYFMKKCQDEQLAKKIIALVRKKSSLWMMCYVPAFCWILATVLEHVFKSFCVKEFRGDTVTEVYTNFLVVMVTYHHQHRGHGKEKIEKIFQLLQSDQIALMNLGKLAFQYLKSQTFVFYEEDLKSFNVDISSIFGGFCREYYIEYTALSHRRVYSFVHTTVQEYFAALYIFVSYHNEKRNLMSSSILGYFWEIFSKPTFFQVCKSACNEMVQSQTGHLDLFLQFLCGLGKKRIQKCLQGLLTHMQERDDDLQNTSNYIKELLQRDIHPERCINLFHCLNELNDKSVMREIIRSIQHGVLSSQKLSRADYSALAFVLKTSDMDRKEFDLSKYRTSPDGLKRLSPVIKYFEKITLTGSIMDEEMITSISALLLSTENQIKELCLTNNTLGDLGLKKLAAALMNSNCRLETLVLHKTGLTEDCCEDLASTLRTSQRLITLELGYNNLGDVGVQRLSEALKYPNCKLQTLGLYRNNLTNACCPDLASGLIASSTLTELNLTSNNLRDSGVKLLFAALKDIHYALQDISLKDNGLTAACCEDILSALRVTHTLRELNLQLNNLGISAINLQCIAQQSNCKLYL